MPGQFYIEGKKQKVDVTQIVNVITNLQQIMQSLIVFQGETTAPGAPDGSTLICSDLTTKPDYDGDLVVIKSGAFQGQSRTINGATTGGTVTPDTHFGGQILAAIKFDIVAIRVGSVDLAAILARLDDATFGLAALKALIDAVEGKLDGSTSGLAALKALLDILTVINAVIRAQTDKLAGVVPAPGSTTAAWGTAEADVVSIGADGVRNKVHDLTLSIHNLVGTVINVRMYKKVNGTERKCYDQPFNAATDPPGLPIVNGTWGIHGVLRVTLQSNNAADNGAVDYDYMLEAM